MKNDRYWLWLQRIVGYGARISEIVSYFGSAKGLYEAGEKEWLDSRLFGNDLIELNPKRIELMKTLTLSFADEVVAYCKDNDIGILTPDDKEYPKQLLVLPNFPAVLFFRGKIDCLQSDSIFAVIGTRNPSDYGKNACKTIVSDMTKNGSVIVSGGALGIDSAAHRACVEAGGSTVLVMGTGIDSNYLKQNLPLREKTAERGCVISEYAPKAQGSVSSFPLRNRIVAALSKGIVVFEAGEKSGTLNTCTHARKLGKPIFVLPGSIDSELYIGSNRLIDEGAIPVFSAETVLKYFDMKVSVRHSAPSGMDPFSGIGSFSSDPSEPAGVTRTQRLKKATEKKKESIQNDRVALNASADLESIDPHPEADLEALSENARGVLSSLRGGNRSLDDIVRDIRKPVHLVLRALSELEMEGFIEKTDSTNYKVK